MRLAIISIIGAVIAANLPAADPRWIRIQSPNFEIYSTASEGSTRDRLNQFEQVRAFFLNSLNNTDSKPLPVRIIQFSSDKEFQPYRINAASTAYYKSGAERDTIVMSHGGSENLPISVHEYVHLVMRHAGYTLPPWLNEGVAEFYSTLRPYGNKIVVGDPIAGRISEMQRTKWVPLSVILAVDQKSPYYNEKNKAGNFYDEAWALTHMLMVSPDYRPKWGEFAKAVLAGAESVGALTSIYGKPLGAIDQDLQQYTERTSFNAFTANAQLERVSEKYPAAPAPALDVKLMLLDIATGTTNEQKQRELQQLAKEDPSRPEPYVQLGYLAWGSGKPAGSDVQELFDKAYALGGRSPRMLWDYGRMIMAGKPADSVRALAELSDLEPARRDVKIELAKAMLNAGHPDDAIKTLVSLKGCTVDEGVGCYSVASVAYYQLNEKARAQLAADSYLQTAKTSEDRQRAQQILDALKATATQTARPNPPAPQRPQNTDTSNAPQQPPPAVRTVVPRIAGLTTITGAFTELICAGPNRDVPNQLVLRTPAGVKRFMFDDPLKVAASSKGSDSVEIPCGVQDPAAEVDLGFIAPAEGSNTDGIIRTLHFQ